MMATPDWHPATVTSTASVDGHPGIATMFSLSDPLPLPTLNPNTFLNQLPSVWVHGVTSSPPPLKLHCGTDEVELPLPSLTSVSAVLHMARSTTAEENSRAEAERSSELSTSALDEPLSTRGVLSAESFAAVQQDSTDTNRCAIESANEVTLTSHPTPREIAPSVVNHKAFLLLKCQPQTDATVLDHQVGCRVSYQIELDSRVF